MIFNNLYTDLFCDMQIAMMHSGAVLSLETWGVRPPIVLGP